MHPPGVHLRVATLDDVSTGARLHRACWQEAYGPFVDATALARQLDDEASWEEAWRRQIEGGPPRMLAIGDDRPVGFAVAGPNREAGLELRELYALYVRRDFWGTGVGQALFDEVVGAEPCSLWVLEDNARARAFYSRNGFSADGGRHLMEQLGAWEVRLTRP